ncbi:MAG: hypothetical protein WA892_11405 [Ornithinimicrobium sp.]
MSTSALETTATLEAIDDPQHNEEHLSTGWEPDVPAETRWYGDICGTGRPTAIGMRVPAVA